MSNVIEFSVKAIDDFSAVMSKATSNISKLDVALISASIAAAAYTSVRMAQQSLDNAEAMGVAAEKANMTVEAYSALAWAAQMSNVEAGNLAVGLRQLNKAMAEGEATPAGRQLELLGIAAKDAEGKLRPVEDVLFDIADAFAAAHDDANKTKAAMEIFSRAGKDMVPLLNQGGQAIRDMMDDAKKLGVVISTDFAQSADQINDNLATLAAVVKGSVNIALTKLSPVLEQVTGEIINFATHGDGAAKVGETLAAGLRLIVSAGIAATGVILTIGEGIGGLAAMIASDKPMEEFLASTDIFKDAGTNIADTLKSISKVWDEGAQSQEAASARQMKAMRDGADALAIETKATEDARKKKEELAKSIDDTIAGMVGQIRAFGQSAEQAKVMEFATKGASDAQVAMAKTVANTLEALRLLESQRSPMEKHAEMLTSINRLHSEGAMSVDKYTAAIERENKAWAMAKVSTQEYKDAAVDVSMTLTDLFIAQQASMGSVAYQTAVLMQESFNNLAKGVGDAVANSIVSGASLLDGFKNIIKEVLKQIISSYITMQIQQAIFSEAGNKVTASSAMANITASAGRAFAATWADVAENMPYGWAYGEAIATGVAQGVMAGGATYAGVAAIAHGGMDNVPSESTFLLDKGERVLSPRQNRDLTDFLESSGGGGGALSIGVVEIHILENATSADAFTRMDKIELRNALGQPVIDALNEMWKFGVQPNFATRRS